MSADNGIYILKTKENLFKVIYAQAIDNLNWSWINGGEIHKNPQPVRLVEFFGKTKATKDVNKAFSIARTLLKRKTKEQGYVEYGINVIKVPYTWQQIRRKAKEEIQIEKNFLKTHPSEYHNFQLKKLNELEI